MVVGEVQIHLRGKLKKSVFWFIFIKTLHEYFNYSPERHTEIYKNFLRKLYKYRFNIISHRLMEFLTTFSMGRVNDKIYLNKKN